MKIGTRVLYVSSFPLFSSSYWSTIAGMEIACWKFRMKKSSWITCLVFTPSSQPSRVILASWLWEEKKPTEDMQSFVETCYPRNKLFFGSLPENISWALLSIPTIKGNWNIFISLELVHCNPYFWASISIY